MRSLCVMLFTLIVLLTGLQGQTNSASGSFYGDGESIIRQDTARELRKRNSLTSAQPDTNFTYEKYASFLKKVSDTSKYIVLPINEFRTTINSNKVVIGLRHDVDLDLNKAFEFSSTESDLGFRATYYILHTASYYLENAGNMALHSERILPTLRFMQNERKHEIGWHSDLVTLQAVYNINPFTFLGSELAWLRANGIDIYGSASHGSPYCYSYKYLNYYFFEECTYAVAGQFTNNLTLPIGGKVVPMIKGRFSDFNLQYEAYFLNNNKYFSDASITNGIRWNIGMLDISQLKPGDRVIILLHPIHWHKASILADIVSFSIPEQLSSVIDNASSTITITIPDGRDRSSLKPTFSLSPGAYAKTGGGMQTSGLSSNDFSMPVTYAVYAENREVTRNWTINVGYLLTSSESEALSYELIVFPNPSDGRFNLQFNGVSLPGVTIDVYNSLGTKVYTAIVNKTGNFVETVDLSSMPAGIYYLKYSGSEKTFPLVIKPE